MRKRIFFFHFSLILLLISGCSNGGINSISSGTLLGERTRVLEIAPVVIKDIKGIDESIEITVVFDKEVTVETNGGNSPFLALEIGSVKKYATYQSGSGSKELIFTYTIANEDRDDDGISVVSSIDTNGGTIKGSSEDALLDMILPQVFSRLFVNFTEKIFSTSRSLCSSRLRWLSYYLG